MLDTTEPGLTEKARSNYIDGFHVLQAEPKRDLSNLSTLIPLAIQACSKQVIAEQLGRAVTPVDANTINHRIACRRNIGKSRSSVAALMDTAFKTIDEASKRSSLQPPASKITTFGASLPTLASDIAPYVRSIVSYDLRLEEQRLQLSRLLSHGGRSGQPRRTRASRAALEGGSKAHTRRERWFPQHTNFSLVLQTGGEEWPTVALEALPSRQASAEGAVSRRGSRRSSMDTGSSEA